ncbi:hypothetical protein BD560DRAFT_409423 [Blakeslea trispora]|nr:hypothetical protein BD560DRAFT_409423 [Blakeslea trispora]
MMIQMKHTTHQRRPQAILPNNLYNLPKATSTLSVQDWKIISLPPMPKQYISSSCAHGPVLIFLGIKQWMADGMYLTAKFLEYRTKAYNAAKMAERLTVIDRLALNFICLISPSSQIDNCDISLYIL